VPSILGFIALATAGNEALRGRLAARFEAATLAGIGVGFAAAPTLFTLFGRNAFFLNALIYLGSFLIYRFLVDDAPGEREARAARHTNLRRYIALVTSSHVWLLAPTWIAVNASIGLWFSQSIFQFAQRDPSFPDQFLHRGFTTLEITLAAMAIGIVFGAGLIYWGNRFKNMRRTTIILYGILGGALLVAAGVVINHGAGLSLVVPIAAILAAAFGLFVLAGATPAALGLLADISEQHPGDRGAIMGLYSVFLALGQIIGSLIGGFAARQRGIDGLLVATLALLAVALVPLWRLRAFEHYVGGTEDVAVLYGDEPPEPAD
jgi:predicted MFS family arabinose efflux permease